MPHLQPIPLNVHSQGAALAPPPPPEPLRLRPHTNGEVFKCFSVQAFKAMCSHGPTLFMVHAIRDLALQSYDAAGLDRDRMSPGSALFTSAFLLATIAWDTHFTRQAAESLHRVNNSQHGVPPRHSLPGARLKAFIPSLVAITGAMLALQEEEGGALKAFDIAVLTNMFRVWRMWRDISQNGLFGGTRTSVLTHPDGTALTDPETSELENERLMAQWAFYMALSFLAFAWAAPAMAELVGDGAAQRGLDFFQRSNARSVSSISLGLEMVDEATPLLARALIARRSEGKLTMRITQGGGWFPTGWWQKALRNGEMRGLTGTTVSDFIAVLSGISSGNKAMEALIPIFQSFLNSLIEWRGYLAILGLKLGDRQKVFEHLAEKFVNSVERQSGVTFAPEDRERMKDQLHQLAVEICSEGQEFKAAMRMLGDLTPSQTIDVAGNAFGRGGHVTGAAVLAGAALARPVESEDDEGPIELVIPPALLSALLEGDASASAASEAAAGPSYSRGQQVTLGGRDMLVMTDASERAVRLKPTDDVTPEELEQIRSRPQDSASSSSPMSPAQEASAALPRLPMRTNMRFSLGGEHFVVARSNYGGNGDVLIKGSRDEENLGMRAFSKYRRVGQYRGFHYHVLAKDIPRLQATVAGTALPVPAPQREDRDDEKYSGTPDPVSRSASTRVSVRGMPSPEHVRAREARLAMIEPGTMLRLNGQTCVVLDMGRSGQVSLQMMLDNDVVPFQLSREDLGDMLLAEGEHDARERIGDPKQFFLALKSNPRMLYGQAVVNVELHAGARNCTISSNAAVLDLSLHGDGASRPASVQELHELHRNGTLTFGTPTDEFIWRLNKGVLLADAEGKVFRVEERDGKFCQLRDVESRVVTIIPLDMLQNQYHKGLMTLLDDAPTTISPKV